MASTDSDPQLETAHVLFVDIVGYSAQPMEAQRRLLEELQELVRQTREFGRALAAGDSISLPTGDGMALVFFRDPVAPAQCAVEISGAMARHPDSSSRSHGRRH